jgi:predicted transcriptional regulator
MRLTTAAAVLGLAVSWPGRLLSEEKSRVLEKATQPSSPDNQDAKPARKRDFTVRSDAAGGKLASFRVTSGDGGRLARGDLEGRVAVIFYETRQVVEKNRTLKNALFKLAEKAFPDKNQWAPVAIVDASGANFFTRGIWRRELRKASKKEGLTIYGDWNSSARKALKARVGESNVIVVDAAGKVRYFAFGRLDDKEVEKLKALVLRLRDEQKKQTKQKEAAASKEERKGGSEADGGKPVESGAQNSETPREPE